MDSWFWYDADQATAAIIRAREQVFVYATPFLEPRCLILGATLDRTGTHSRKWEQFGDVAAVGGRHGLSCATSVMGGGVPDHGVYGYTGCPPSLAEAAVRASCRYGFGDLIGSSLELERASCSGSQAFYQDSIMLCVLAACSTLSTVTPPTRQ